MSTSPDARRARRSPRPTTPIARRCASMRGHDAGAAARPVGPNVGRHRAGVGEARRRRRAPRGSRRVPAGSAVRARGHRGRRRRQHLSRAGCSSSGAVARVRGPGAGRLARARRGPWRSSRRGIGRGPAPRRSRSVPDRSSWIDVAGDGSLGYNTADVERGLSARRRGRVRDAGRRGGRRLSAGHGRREDDHRRPRFDPGGRRQPRRGRDPAAPRRRPAGAARGRRASSPDPAPPPKRRPRPPPSHRSAADATADPSASVGSPSDDRPRRRRAHRGGGQPDVDRPSVRADAPADRHPDAEPRSHAGGPLPIASDIEVIGQSAAFSRRWRVVRLHRPSGGRRHRIRRLSVEGRRGRRPAPDHRRRVAFASWAGDQVVVSRPVEGDTSAASRRRSTGTTVTVDPVRPESRRDLHDVAARGRPEGRTGRRLDRDRDAPTPTARGVRTKADSSCSPGPRPARPQRAQVVSDAPWATSTSAGTRPASGSLSGPPTPPTPTIGRLSLFGSTPRPASSVRPRRARSDVPALPGFSIGDGRLAWATPPGQGGEGSRVQIVAWAGDGVGSIESAPGEDARRHPLTRDGPLRTRPDPAGADWYRSPPIVRPRWTVVGVALTATLALVALPGLAGSRAPSAVEPVPAGAFQPLLAPRVRAATRRSPIARARLAATCRGLRADGRHVLERAGPAAGRRRPLERSPTSPIRAAAPRASRRGPTLTGEATFYDARSHRDAPARAARSSSCAAPAAASSGSSTTTARTQHGRGSSTCIGRTSSRICGCPSWSGVADVTVYVY